MFLVGFIIQNINKRFISLQKIMKLLVLMKFQVSHLKIEQGILKLALEIRLLLLAAWVKILCLMIIMFLILMNLNGIK